MSYISTLENVKEGSKVIIKQLLSVGETRRRLMDLGLIEGTTVECLQRSPSGDPVAYYIRGTVIALRSEDSSKILVNKFLQAD